MPTMRIPFSALGFALLLIVAHPARADVMGMWDPESGDECVRGGAGAACIDGTGVAGRCRWKPRRNGYYCTPITECERRDAGAACHERRGASAHCIPAVDAGRGWPTRVCVRDDSVDAGAARNDAQVPAADASVDATAAATARTPEEATRLIVSEARALDREQRACACAAPGAGSFDGRSAGALFGIAAFMMAFCRRTLRLKAFDNREKTRVDGKEEER